ncbi:biotin-dependent carboxyltransferase family protein [Pseudomonas stutzeri]|uniref:5-oxoprolinase subunit C family protein n=1 Tax=Stutzerimonas stutzeri TaxID=316 RepID=UPI00210BB2D7|nr:biotin-dependent carboxyltransferase family protein [Stutzerimonas stutzeri]MCQ4313393.1 biotin-dependent carboxyltransferase family protein [Stutzerimonas stutzeri]
MSAITVDYSRSLALLQDGGRFGVRHLGVTQGGAFDWVSMYWANWLLGNALDAPVIEITLGGLRLICERDGCLALAGADLQATLDDRPLQPWRSFSVRRGQVLTFAQPRLGARAYLAAPGGFEGERVLGSVATVARESLGGLRGDGQPLRPGDRLNWNGQDGVLKQVPEAQIPDLSASRPLDLVVGAQIGEFGGQSLYDTFNSDWTVDMRSDRMGVRLTGPQLRCRVSGIVSEGVPLGAVQVPPDGQPIVLLNDRQTIGGYPRLGALTPEAVARLGQCLPGSRIRLRPVVQRSAEFIQQQLLLNWR